MFVLYCAHLCMKCSLVSLIFLMRSLVFPILLFSSVSLHCSFRKAFLSLFAILWNFAFRWVYLSFSPLPFASLLSSAICEVSSDNHFVFLHFFPLGDGFDHYILQRVIVDKVKPRDIIFQIITIHMVDAIYIRVLSNNEQPAETISRKEHWMDVK